MATDVVVADVPCPSCGARNCCSRTNCHSCNVNLLYDGGF